MILGIDPGNHPGWALVNDTGVLIACGAKDFPPPYAGIAVVVIELPMIYPRSPVPPNDIVKLAYTAGLLASRYTNVRTVSPVTWKKSVPKNVMTRRILASLSPEERQIAGNDHNVIDAIGIAKWAHKEGWK
jgi:hypothetical protein